MRFIYFYIFLTFFTTASYTQPVDQKTIDNLILHQRYADAHLILDSLANASKQPANWYCQILSNIRQNYHFQREGRVFYLRNIDPDGRWDPVNLAIHQPQRQLEKLTSENPQFGCGQLELGLFYIVVNQLDQQQPSEQGVIKPYHPKQILTRFESAAQQAISHPVLNRWLGIYYFDEGELALSRKFLQKNIMAELRDPLTYLYLAEIHFSQQRFSQCYNYTRQALQMQETLEPDIHYSILRLAALSLQALGETARFVEYVFQAINIFPDEQETYLLLANHFISRRNFEESNKTYRQMLLQNPYDRNGYEQIEKYSVNLEDFYFSETLLEELSVHFDGDNEALALIHEFRGNLLYHQGMLKESEKQWEISRGYFRKFLPDDSPQMQLVGEIARHHRTP